MPSEDRPANSCSPGQARSASRNAFQARRSDVGCQSRAPRHYFLNSIVTSLNNPRATLEMARYRRHGRIQICTSLHLETTGATKEGRREPARVLGEVVNVDKSIGPLRMYVVFCKPMQDLCELQRGRKCAQMACFNHCMHSWTSSIDMQRYMHAKGVLQRVPA